MWPHLPDASLARWESNPRCQCTRHFDPRLAQQASLVQAYGHKPVGTEQRMRAAFALAGWPGMPIMRAIAGTLCVALLFCCSSARAQSANELLQACESLERTMTVLSDNISFPPSQTNDECWYFMSAVQQYSTLAAPGGQRFLGACTEPTTTLSQLIRAFTNYARSHPQHLNATATVVTYNAMQSTFPCS
jgi:Rap1a immunity proteins